jgi:peroxiredoxin
VWARPGGRARAVGTIGQESADTGEGHVVATSSTMLPLGTEAPPFDLADPAGRRYTNDDFAAAPVLVVMFICNHCPYVKHLRRSLARVTRELSARDVAFVGVNSNDADAHPDDSPEAMAREVAEQGYEFPYLVDDTQAVARAYRAACTPDFFVFDGERRLVYRGQYDDSRPGNGVPVTGADLVGAVEAALTGGQVPSDQRPSMGCNIKWKPGNEPEWFG